MYIRIVVCVLDHSNTYTCVFIYMYTNFIEIPPSLLIAGAPPMDVPQVEQPMPVPPMDGTADHPNHYIPEPVRHFLPYFHKQIMEKVYNTIQICVKLTFYRC